jgi:hypothetical protein
MSYAHLFKYIVIGDAGQLENAPPVDPFLLLLITGGGPWIPELLAALVAREIYPTYRHLIAILCRCWQVVPAAAVHRQAVPAPA